jgi:hypothetical protein
MERCRRANHAFFAHLSLIVPEFGMALAPCWRKQVAGQSAAQFLRALFITKNVYRTVADRVRLC